MPDTTPSPGRIETAARWVFGIAAGWGFLSLLPMYGFEQVIATHNPPALTHPEFFYGFLGVALAWQLLFAFIARHPARLRQAMPAAIAEKWLYAGTVFVLVAAQRTDVSILPFALVDLVLGSAFLIVYVRLGAPSDRARPA